VTGLIFICCVCVSCSCVCSVFSILTTLTYFTIRIQICVRCYSSGLIRVCQLFVLHLLNVFCVFWVVTLCSQLLCLCLRCCCARVVALVCLCRLQPYVCLFSDLSVFSCYLLFYFLCYQFVYLVLHVFINAFLYLVLYANTCHVLCFVYRCTCHCFSLFVLFILFML